MRHTLSLIALLLVTLGARAGDPPLPQASKARFLGVETCGSSQCHGSPEPWRNATVMMKERLVWDAHDPHARAWQALVGERGRAIAARLGLAEPGRAPECLTCHATFVPPAQRGQVFDIEQGVGCESCHGAGGAGPPGAHSNPQAGSCKDGGIWHAQHYPRRSALSSWLRTL